MMGPRARRLGALLNAAGGLRYHLRAFRYRERLWGDFARALAHWLEAWAPPTRALLLVGPSAGYCLPGPWLAGFATVDALDPDPVARLLLPRRFPLLRGRVRWHDASYLAPTAGGLSPTGLEALARDFPAHAILFCNLIGQLPLLHPAAAALPSFATWKRGLERTLADRQWATFHDRLSGPLAPRLAGPGDASATPLADEELIDRFYLGQPSRRVELETHLTGDLFPGYPRRYLSWEIVPGWFHLIEAIHS